MQLYNWQIENKHAQIYQDNEIQQKMLPITKEPNLVKKPILAN